MNGSIRHWVQSLFVSMIAIGCISSSLAADRAAVGSGPSALVGKSSMKAALQTLPEVEIALNWKPEPQFGGFYSAQLKGIDKQNGLSFKITPGGAGTPVVQMVASGKHDFGISSADEVIMTQSRGSDVVALFAVFQTNPQGIMTHAERRFSSLEDVFRSEGTVAMQKGLPYAAYLLQKYKSVMKATIVPYVGGISNFLTEKKHSQQCFITSEPVLAEKESMKAKTFLVADSGFNPYTTVLITRRQILLQKPDLARKVVKAVQQGWVVYLESPDDTNRHMTTLNSTLDLEAMRVSANRQKKLIMSRSDDREKLDMKLLGRMDKERWAELVDQMKSLKLIRKSVDPGQLFVQFDEKLEEKVAQ